MKQTILFLIVFTLTLNGFSQLNQKRFHVQTKVGFGTMNQLNYTQYGLTGEFITSKKVGLLYNFEQLNRGTQFKHIHTPMGLVGGPIVLVGGLAKAFDADTTTKGSFGIIGGLLLLALPDGLTYHQNIGYHMDLAPYVNILGIDFIKNKVEDNLKIKYACSAGVKATYLLSDKFTGSVFIETRKIAGIKPGIGAGIQLGYTWGSSQE
jgi:hypothetical protein